MFITFGELAKKARLLMDDNYSNINYTYLPITIMAYWAPA